MLTGENYFMRKIFALPEVWAHRGARSAAPENTMAAARAALAQGAHGWELDVHLTTRHGPERIAPLEPAPRIQTANLIQGQPIHHVMPARGHPRPRCNVRNAAQTVVVSDNDLAVKGEVDVGQLAAFAGEAIPSLAEALAWTQGSGLAVNVEIKDMLGRDDAGLVYAVAGLIRAARLDGRVLVSSFRPQG